MVYGAIDLHTRYSHVRMVDAGGTGMRAQRVLTTAERLVHAFAGHGPLPVYDFDGLHTSYHDIW